MHASKGREFDHVWLPGWSSKGFPRCDADDGGSIEAERRLAFVAITRTRHNLTISRADRYKRSEWDKEQILDGQPSPFIAEIAKDGAR